MRRIGRRGLANSRSLAGPRGDNENCLTRFVRTVSRSNLYLKMLRRADAGDFNKGDMAPAPAPIPAPPCEERRAEPGVPSFRGVLFSPRAGVREPEPSSSVRNTSSWVDGWILDLKETRSTT